MLNTEISTLVKSIPKYTNMTSKLIKIASDVVDIDIGKAICSSVAHNVMSKVVITTKDYRFDSALDVIHQINPNMFSGNRTLDSLNGGTHISNDRALYITPLNNFNWMVVQYTDNCTIQDDGDEYMFPPKLSVLFIGNNHDNYCCKFINKINKLTNGDRKFINISLVSNVTVNGVARSRGFDSIIIPDSFRADIVGGLENGRKMREWYEQHHLSYTLGGLLRGEPGTGKSSVIRAVSHMFNNAPILVFSRTELRCMINAIKRAKTRSQNNTVIVVFEDIDTIFPFNRESEDQIPKDSYEQRRLMLDQGDILQLLDGVWSPDDVIFVATTNHYDHLDPALVRPGRFSIQVELNYFGFSEAQQFAEMFEVSTTELESLNLQYPIKPAKLQDIIMEFCSNRIKNANTEEGVATKLKKDCDKCIFGIYHEYPNGIEAPRECHGKNYSSEDAIAAMKADECDMYEEGHKLYEKYFKTGLHLQLSASQQYITDRKDFSKEPTCICTSSRDNCNRGENGYCYCRLHCSSQKAYEGTREAMKQEPYIPKTDLK